MADKDKIDDLDAVRTLVDTLAQLDADTQERVIRWAREKLGLANAVAPALTSTVPLRQPVGSGGTPVQPSSSSDIKSFISAKKPSSNNEFTAAVAYYYRFEAPQGNRKESITADDLQEACRLSGRARFNRPAQTLVNAHQTGLIDKAGDRGAYSISTVGENLVAMTLPSDGTSRSGTGTTRRAKKNSVTRTKIAKTRKSSKRAKGQ